MRNTVEFRHKKMEYISGVHPMAKKANLVDNQKVRLGDTRSSLSRNLISSADVDYVDNVISQFSRVIG